MGMVQFIVDAADQGLDTIAESQFATIASGMGNAILLMMTLALIFLFINMSLQIRPMSGADVFYLLVKIVLIQIFAFNWVQFNQVSGGIIDGIDNVAGLFIGSITGGTGTGSAFFAERFDQLTNDLSAYANQIGAQLNWMAGAMMSVLLVVLLSLLGGVAALIMVLAKMVATLLLGLAPIMIALSLFKVTEDYFKRWLAALVSWSLYPVVIAGVFSVIFGLIDLLQAELGDATDISSIGMALPFLMVVFLSFALVLFIPLIVRTLSGDLNAGLAGSVVGAVSRQAYLGLGSPRRGSQMQPRTPTGPPSQNPVNPTPIPPPRQSTGTGASLARIMARNERLDRASKDRTDERRN
ncbi:type IV secretion system protein [Loktanella sp. S4079]|uniref:type IV secretion system protein n=1 Tax=Loktanella sp. S4079 TaxID=579483 RepID=UPI0005F9DB37|nr:type IV secretion system protein [Loktanella sp. S4079]